MFKFFSPWPNLLVTELFVSNMDKGNLVFLGSFPRITGVPLEYKDRENKPLRLISTCCWDPQ